jgi:hypothetical protein
MAVYRKELGGNYLVFINTNTSGTGDPVWKIAMCQTDLTVTRPKTTVNADSKSGSDTRIQPGSETVSFGAQILQEDATQPQHLTRYDLGQLFNAGQPVEFKIGPKGETAEEDGKIIYEFTGNITNLADTYSNGDIATTTIDVAVIGQIEETKFVFTT